MHKDGKKCKMARDLETSDSYMYMRWLFKTNLLRYIFGILVNDICKNQTLETSLTFDITYVYASLNV